MRQLHQMCHSLGMVKRYLRTAAAADALGISRWSLNRWVRKGLVTPAFVSPGGRQSYWDLDDLFRQLRAAGAVPEGKPMTEPAELAASAPVKPPVVSAIVTSDLGVLVSRRNDGDPPWAFIGGKVHEGESPRDASIREVKEETGLRVRVGPGDVIGERIHPKNGTHMIYMHAVPIDAADAWNVFVGDKQELAEVRWVSLAEAEALMQPYPMFEPVRAFLARTL
jgi:8-oxo-dGTP pyrophosphatase MutT (NUDIX family)